MQNDPDLKKSLNFLRCFAKGEPQHLWEQIYNKFWNKGLITERWGLFAWSVLETSCQQSNLCYAEVGDGIYLTEKQQGCLHRWLYLWEERERQHL